LAAGDTWSILIIGFLSATVAGYVAIRFLLGYVLQHRYDAFVAYRLALALLVLVIV
jgi:undecaprenyl-diphosphatase